jgi:hypothetical protein
MRNWRRAIFDEIATHVAPNAHAALTFDRAGWRPTGFTDGHAHCFKRNIGGGLGEEIKRQDR